MKWSVLIAVVVIGAAFGIGFLVADRDDGIEPTPTPSATEEPVTSSPANPAPALRTSATHTVRLTSAGPVPRELRITAGDLVIMVSDVAGIWPASDPHPVHTLCPGFDAKRSLGVGDDYSIVFSVPRTCSYHDHLNPSDSTRRGTIIIQ